MSNGIVADRDRLETLRSSNTITGIAFISVNPEARELYIHFHHDNPSGRLAGLTPDDIEIRASDAGTLPERIEVVALTWKYLADIEANVRRNRRVLRVKVDSIGGFGPYRLKIESSRVDRYYNDVEFNFRVGCPSLVDCRESEVDCPSAEQKDFPVDYLARDFWSFRRALLDFASQQYPRWQDRYTADAAVMLVEVMSAMADEMAYYQDRVGREAYLESCSQRRSARAHARLVDYEIRDGCGASTWLDVTARAGSTINLPTGMHVWAGEEPDTVHFEVGYGLNSTETFRVSSDLNEFEPHIWDEDDTCLFAGSTELYIEGHHASDLGPGKWILLRTDPTDPSEPVRRWMVMLAQVTDTRDEVFGIEITRLTWDPVYAPPFDVDLASMLVRCNLVPITAGRSLEQFFVVGDPSEDTPTSVERDGETIVLATAVVREGADDTVSYRVSLEQTDDQGLVFLEDDSGVAFPEIRVEEGTFDGNTWNSAGSWEWRPSLLGSAKPSYLASLPGDKVFTLEDGFWREVVSYRRPSVNVLEHIDYAGDAGMTIRFGDGEFGLIPPSQTVFRVLYRVGNGTATNVAHDTIVNFEGDIDGTAATDVIEAVTNPVIATNGCDPETMEQIRSNAPQDYQYETFRAVRPEDYSEAAERLEWVQRAGTEFRWTGSWLSVFTTPDPLDAVELTDTQRDELRAQLDRYRQAGRETHVGEPVYADIDLWIDVCLEPTATQGAVREALMKALVGTPSSEPEEEFFHADNFTFGTPLIRSALEAAVQRVDGVRAVEAIDFRHRGRTERSRLTGRYDVGTSEVIRVENDPRYPDRGSVHLGMRGGR